MRVPKRQPGDGDWLYLGWYATAHWVRHIQPFRGKLLEVDLPRLLVFPPVDKGHGRRYLIHKDLIDG